MIEKFLKRVSMTLSDYFKTEIGVCEIHPGVLTQKEQNNLKNYSPVIYTTITDILECEKISSGEVKNSVRVVSFILTYDLLAKNRDVVIRNLVFKMTNLLLSQRWNLEYVFGAQQIKAFDLHGLLKNPNDVIGDQGWNPTLQARANDLFSQLEHQKDPQFSIWAITWEQDIIYAKEQEYNPYPKAINFPIKLIANVDELKLVEFFSNRLDQSRVILTGKVILPKSKETNTIAYFDLYWFNKDKNPLDDQKKVHRFKQGEKEYQFKANTPLPKDAYYLGVISKSDDGSYGETVFTAVRNICIEDTSIVGACSDHDSYFDKKFKDIQKKQGIRENLYKASQYEQTLYMLLSEKDHISKIISYDLENNELNQIKSSIYLSQCAFINTYNQLYFLGGCDINQNPVNKFYSYHLVQKKWFELEPFAKAIKNSTCTIDDNKLYSFGGLDSSNTPINEIWCYDFFGTSWEYIGALPKKISHCAVCIKNGNFYISGGIGEDEKPSNEVYVFLR